MTNIIVVFPKQEDAISIRNLLARNGFHVAGICSTGAQAISVADELNDGVVICGYKMPDMVYSELHDFLPSGFEMLLVASRHYLSDCLGNDLVCLAMPIKVHELLDTVSMMVGHVERRRRKRREKPEERSGEEKSLLREAKVLLMGRNNMTEEEAHRYLQKCSMDSGTNMVETARMVLTMMKA